MPSRPPQPTWGHVFRREGARQRAHLLPAFGAQRLEDVSADEVEVWSAQLAARGLANATQLRILTCRFGVMKRAKRIWKLPRNPFADVEKPIQHHAAIELQVFSPEEIHALVRAAESGQDARSSLPPRTRAFAAASSWHCAGARLTSGAERCA